MMGPPSLQERALVPSGAMSSYLRPVGLAEAVAMGEGRLSPPHWGWQVSGLDVEIQVRAPAALLADSSFEQVFPSLNPLCRLWV